MVVFRVTKIEQEKERNGNRGSRRDRKGHGTKERGVEKRYPRRSVAGGEDGSPSKSSLVTMNGPNESRGPIKDYSKRRSTITGLALGSILEVRGTKGTRKMGGQTEFLHACLAFASLHLIGT